MNIKAREDTCNGISPPSSKPIEDELQFKAEILGWLEQRMLCAGGFTASAVNLAELRTCCGELRWRAESRRVLHFLH
jgi:hypothetical protein